MMLSRCSRPGDNRYDRYGGRESNPIKVCERWRKFENFYADMGDRPAGMTLDRIDGVRNYEPGNCRWATPKQQQRNLRTNRLITHNGETLCLAEWAERTGIGRTTIRKRLTLGWPVDRALTVGVGGRRD
jgi:hypothetical protein